MPIYESGKIWELEQFEDFPPRTKGDMVKYGIGFVVTLTALFQLNVQKITDSDPHNHGGKPCNDSRTIAPLNGGQTTTNTTTTNHATSSGCGCAGCTITTIRNASREPEDENAET